MKTALQELIDYAIDKYGSDSNVANDLICQAMMLKKEEKENILYVYNKGCEDGHNGFAEKSFEDIIQ